MYRHIKVRQVGDVSVVTFNAKIISDDQVIAWILQDFRTLLYEEDSRAIILNFDGVTRFTSGMTNILLTFRTDVAGIGGRLRLCNLSPQMAQAFEITGLTRGPNPVFDVKATEEEALATESWLPLVIIKPPAK